MQIDILTLFPEMFSGPFSESILKRAQEKGLLEINLHNLRDWSKDKHKTVDDKPFGGGAGMILMCQPIFDAIEELSESKSKPYVIFTTPQGRVFNQRIAQKLAKKKRLLILCGHYEGVDERVRENIIDEEISIGDYVLTGGELPAMVLVDTVSRLLSGVIENPEATKIDSFSRNRLEHPQYTRPANFCGMEVPKVLLSGNHVQIEQWKEEKSLKRTKERRPEILKG